MKKIALVLCMIIVSLSVIGCGYSKADAYGCYTDIDDAITVASKKNQDIMIIVSLDSDGEDSFDFMNKVVRVPEFKSDIASKYSVVCMDFSQKAYESATALDNAGNSVKKNAEKNNEIIQKNARYATMLSVTKTPAIYILSKEQYFIVGLYYDDENRSVEGFKSILSKNNSLVDEMHTMIYQTKIGTPEEKIRSIDALYEATNPSYRFFLLDLIESVVKLDPFNKTGLVEKYVYDTAVAKSNKAILDGDVKAASQAYLDIVDSELISAESRQKALYTAAFICSRFGIEENSVIINYLEKAILLSPESDDVSAIQRVIAALNKQAQEQSE